MSVVNLVHSFIRKRYMLLTQSHIINADTKTAKQHNTCEVFSYNFIMDRRIFVLYGQFRVGHTCGNGNSTHNYE